MRREVRAECVGAHLVTEDLALGVVFEVTVALEAALDQPAELLRKVLVVEQVVHAQARERRLGRVRRADALLGRADARPAELDLLEAVDDLVKVEDELRAVRDEEAARAVEPWNVARRPAGERKMQGRGSGAHIRTLLLQHVKLHNE